MSAGLSGRHCGSTGRESDSSLVSLGGFGWYAPQSLTPNCSTWAPWGGCFTFVLSACGLLEKEDGQANGQLLVERRGLCPRRPCSTCEHTCAGWAPGRLPGRASYQLVGQHPCGDILPAPFSPGPSHLFRGFQETLSASSCK